ncbi:FKBP-type peptidyl-prolyl cis-trans isomerase [Prevotella sp. AGR2160]|uniref:FKBP-type peptidyl-prolyl cis-trans isomerase n=1 Tax=Prevotella sp. AGR2160 TaxID=1280674 RepID=UPI000427B71A|nr:FKBP-type peptidyl-prolyl cis-trans isomerase [Prevotella sp. AGR2160]
MKKIFLFSVLALAALSMTAAPKNDKKKQVKKLVTTALTTPMDTLSFAAGYAATDGLMPFVKQSYKVDSAHVADFIDGFNEVINETEDPKMNARIAGHVIAQMVADRIFPGVKEQLQNNGAVSRSHFIKGFQAALAKDTTLFNVKKARQYQEDAQAAVGKKWLAENAKKPGVKVLPDGLQYKVLVEGNGPVPKATDEVEVVYEGKTIDGKVFDSTEKHGAKSDKFRANGLIKGWTEALTMMPVGSKWELYIPYDLAYGSRRAGEIAPYSTLIFTLELKSIVAPEEKPATAPVPQAKSKKVKK